MREVLNPTVAAGTAGTVEKAACKSHPASLPFVSIYPLLISDAMTLCRSFVMHVIILEQASYVSILQTLLSNCCWYNISVAVPSHTQQSTTEQK